MSFLRTAYALTPSTDADTIKAVMLLRGASIGAVARACGINDATVSKRLSDAGIRYQVSGRRARII